MNEFQRLYQQRLARATRPFNARGAKLERCKLCRVSVERCICSLRCSTEASASFMLLLYDAEILKPSNTGRLIADVVSDTSAYIWSRTEPSQQMIDALQADDVMPFLVYPADDKDDKELPPNTKNTEFDAARVNYIDELPDLAGKRPLFVLLDGSWREARKMYRKSPYLDSLPLLSLGKVAAQPDKPDDIDNQYIRKAPKLNQLSTAEVAARLLKLSGDVNASTHLSLWFNLFNFRYQKSVRQSNRGDPAAEEKLQDFLRANNKKVGI